MGGVHACKKFKAQYGEVVWLLDTVGDLSN